MSTSTLAQVLAEARLLSRDEQHQLRETLDAWLREDNLEDRLEELLYAAGLLHARTRGDTAAVPPPPFTPIAVQGQPVSETIIAERR